LHREVIAIVKNYLLLALADKVFQKRRLAYVARAENEQGFARLDGGFRAGWGVCVVQQKDDMLDVY
jgi:hypothetical protein